MTAGRDVVRELTIASPRRPLQVEEFLCEIAWEILQDPVPEFVRPAWHVTVMEKRTPRLRLAVRWHCGHGSLLHRQDGPGTALTRRGFRHALTPTPTPTPIGQLTPLKPWLQYPPGFFARYCWW